MPFTMTHNFASSQCVHVKNFVYASDQGILQVREKWDKLVHTSLCNSETTIMFAAE